MIKYCYDKWNANQDKLREYFKKTTGLNDCGYLDLVKACVTYVLNDGLAEPTFYDEYWDADRITTIDDGDYQGTLLFLIPVKTYQPSEYEYLMTYVWYGSCSCCDTLQSIQSWDADCLTEQQVNDFMNLCRHIVSNMIKPYNSGWRSSEEFESVSVD